MRRLLLVAALFAVGAASAAPVPHASSPADVALQVDTRYSTTDSASDTVSFTLSNSGNQTLQVNGLGSVAEGGVSVSCLSSCGASSLSPGGSRFVTLSVVADERASDGLHLLGYPLSFSNAAALSVPISVRVDRLEPGRLTVSIELDAPSLPCPAPSSVSVGGTLTLVNVGDTTVSSATTSLSGPGAVSLSGTPPSSLPPKESRSIPFTLRMPARDLPPLLTVTANGDYASRETRVFSGSGSLALAPPIRFSLQAPSGSGSDVHVAPNLLGILEPYAVPLSLSEACAYQTLQVGSPTGLDPSIVLSPDGPWQVDPGQSTPVTLTVTIPLSSVGLLCTGYSKTLAFAATASGTSTSASLHIEPPVDLAGTRQAIDGLAAAEGAAGVPSELRQSAAGLGSRFAAAIGSGSCTGGTSVRDVLAAAPPVSWAFNLAKASPGAEDRDLLLAMGSMAQSLPGLCDGLSDPALASGCTAFADAYRTYSDERLGAAVRAATTQETGAIGTQRLALQEFLAAAQQRLGAKSEADRWRATASASQTHLDGVRSDAIARFTSQQARDQSWLRSPRAATAGDFRTLDPITFGIVELRYGAALRQYTDAENLAAESGDQSLASAIHEATASLQQAHAAAAPVNYAMVGIWVAVVVAAVGFGAMRALRWTGQARMVRLGDVAAP